MYGGEAASVAACLLHAAACSNDTSVSKLVLYALPTPRARRALPAAASADAEARAVAHVHAELLRVAQSGVAAAAPVMHAPVNPRAFDAELDASVLLAAVPHWNSLPCAPIMVHDVAPLYVSSDTGARGVGEEGAVMAAATVAHGAPAFPPAFPLDTSSAPRPVTYAAGPSPQYGWPSAAAGAVAGLSAAAGARASTGVAGSVAAGGGFASAGRLYRLDDDSPASVGSSGDGAEPPPSLPIKRGRADFAGVAAGADAGAGSAYTNAFQSGRQRLQAELAKPGGGGGGSGGGSSSGGGNSGGGSGGGFGWGRTGAGDDGEGGASPSMYGTSPAYSMGGPRKGVGLRRFKPPSRMGDEGSGLARSHSAGGGAPGTGGARPSATGGGGGAVGGGGGGSGSKLLEEYGDNLPEQLKNLEPRMIEMIENEIMDTGDPVTFADIAGLEQAKAVMVESVIWPMQRPDLFQGLTRQAKGVLLFGPPGTGKTLIGKAVAHECGATFFSISASSLTSKWIGESEKLVRTLFAVAAVKQPSIVFIDEIDSLLTSRSEGEHESSRRVKTEFLVQIDGAATKSTDFVLVIGATNRPQELDEAARRRFTKRVYVPLPDAVSRSALVHRLLRKERHELSEADIEEVVRASDGYSGADVTQVCKEAAMGALRAGFTRALMAAGAGAGGMQSIRKEDLPPIQALDFRNAFESVKPTVAAAELVHYIKWNREFGAEPSRTALETLTIARGAATNSGGSSVPI